MAAYTSKVVAKTVDLCMQETQQVDLQEPTKGVISGSISNVGIGLVLNTLDIAHSCGNSIRLAGTSWRSLLPLLPGGGLTAPALVPEGAAWPSGLPGPSAPLWLPSTASADQQTTFAHKLG